MKAPDNAENATRNRAQTAVIAGVTITAAVVVSLFAIVQLAGVTESFAGLGKHILDAFSGLFRADFWHWLGTEWVHAPGYGGESGEGSSPSRTIRSRWVRGSGVGTALSRTRV